MMLLQSPETVDTVAKPTAHFDGRYFFTNEILHSFTAPSEIESLFDEEIIKFSGLLALLFHDMVSSCLSCYLLSPL